MRRFPSTAAVLLALGIMNCHEVAVGYDGDQTAPGGQGAAATVATTQPTETPASIYKNSIHAVFTIRSERTQGSAFVFAPGFIATNAHVVGDSPMVEVEEQDGNKFRARVVKKNVELDFAILEPEGIHPFTTTISLRTGNAPAIGEGIVVIGSPSGLKGTVTSGIVSQIYPEGVVQLNAAINPGNSGGPVFDMHGRVFGIATAKYLKGDGLGFAIPISRLKP